MANRKACSAILKAVKSGDLPNIKTQTCVDCGKPAKHYDHRDYDKPLEVDPVCVSCNLLRGRANGKHDNVKYIYVEVTAAVKMKALRLAKKYDLSLRQLINRLIKEAK